MVTVNAVGRDITKDLQAIANNPAVSQILFCGSKTGSVFTVNGTVNIPATTVLRFDNGNKISGTGTINGGVIEANHQCQIFDTSLTVNPSKTSDGKFSVNWYGATGDGKTDDTKALQRVLNMLAANLGTGNFKIIIPKGNYLSRHLETPNSASFFTIEGEGMGVTNLSFIGVDGDDFITFINPQRITLKDLTLIGQTTAGEPSK